MRPMSPEERFERIERSIEFIVKQQGQFYTDLSRLEGRTCENTEHIGRLAGILQRAVEKMDRRQAEADGRFQEFDSRFARFDERMQELLEAQRATDERLNILIHIAERHFSNGPPS